MRIFRNCLLFVLFIPGWTFSQEKGNIRQKTILISSDTIAIDTLSLVPGSVKIVSIQGDTLDSLSYKVNYPKGEIIFFKQKKSGFDYDTVIVVYHALPFLLSKEYKHKDISLIRPDLYTKPDIFSYKPNQSISDDLFKTDGLEKNGSISRGISFGNNQDVIVNSNLNLQLSGKLSENIDILMSATDNNIPLQPDGNTQQLQEFDKVFIQLSDKKSKLIAGDFQLLRPGSYFMNYNKRAQGLNFSTAFQPAGLKKVTNNKVMASGAVSKGKFARNVIQGIERNQGPYRLVGSENETYIVVLSGTERVYIDGLLLQRGQENDYIIDYNTAEVRFTPKNLITKDKRIIVEFQYSDRNYARSLIQFTNEFEREKFKLRLNIYSEQDAKNQPLQQQLSAEQKFLLSDIGDSIQFAVIPGIDSVSFTNSLILYNKKDTMVSGVLYKDVYEYSIDPDMAKYKLAFSFVGQGKGNYSPINSTANGKVYQWIAPVLSVKQGAYEPVILLVTPKQKQMIAVTSEYDISKQSKISLETAASNNDINTFSKTDKANDYGFALKLNVDNFKSFLKSDTTEKSRKWIAHSNINYELVDQNFSLVERYRLVEFERDWNRKNSGIINNQHILGAGLSLSQSKTFTVGYAFNSFLEEKNYEGFKHSINAKFDKKGFLFLMNGSSLNTKEMVVNTSFIRSTALLSKKIKWLTIGIKEQQETNQFKNDNDSLLGNSYKFYEWEAFANNSDTSKNKFELAYKQRADFGLKNNSLNKSTFAEHIGLAVGFLNNPNSQITARVTYRTLKIIDSLLTFQKPDNTIISRLEYNFRLFKGVVMSNTFYEIGSGLESKKEFSYLEVAPGQGVYSWIDYNNNEVKELNEFEVAIFKDQAKYIRVYTPTNVFINTYTNEFSEILNLKPSAVWSGKKGIRKVLSRFANQTAYRVDRKTTNDNLEITYNPFLRETKDSSLITLNSSFRNTIFFNQLSPVFGLDYTHQDNRNKSLLTYGNDSRANIFNDYRARWNLTQKFSLIVNYKTGKKSSNSQYFSNKNFQINYTELEPKVNYQPNTVFRYVLLFRYTEKNNIPDYGIQQAIIKDYGMEAKYNILQKGSLNFKANFIQIDYNDAENSSLAFEMLEGLAVGKNITWNISYQRNLSNNMQISLTYDGRKSETSKTIHTGGMQVRAYF